MRQLSFCVVAADRDGARTSLGKDRYFFLTDITFRQVKMNPSLSSSKMDSANLAMRYLAGCHCLCLEGDAMRMIMVLDLTLQAVRTEQDGLTISQSGYQARRHYQNSQERQQSTNQKA
jgi:hypothetical protein